MRGTGVFGKSVRVLLALAMAVVLVPVAAFGSPSDDGRTARRQPSAPSVAGATKQAEKPALAWQSGSDVKGSGFVKNEVIVRFKSNAIGTAAVSTAHKKVGATVKKQLRLLPGAELVTLKPGTSVEEAVAAYEAMPEVLYAQPNYTGRKLAVEVPDDGRFEQLWGLNNTGQSVYGVPGTVDADIDAPEAWFNHTTGDPSIVVAVVDTGVDYAHSDLANNIWFNTGEIPGNGLDDDGNGYTDDVFGIDTINGDSDPMDDVGHGTHCAGTIAAEANNTIGVAGVAPTTYIMPIKIFNENGDTTTAAVVEAFAYARMMGADVISNSWGGIYAADDIERDAIAAVPEALFVFAAGNDGIDTDATAYYPAGYDLDNIIVVGASDNKDTAGGFSNYGATSVDVFAPGVGITSTIPGTTKLVPADGVTYTTLLEEDFSYASDAELDDWWYRDQSGANGFELSTSHYHSAPAAVGLSPYGDDEGAYIETFYPLDLSGATNPMLEFYLSIDTEAGYDYMVWGLYDSDAAVDHQLGYLSGSGENEWVQQVADLSEFAGTDNLYLYFWFVSDESNSSDVGYTGAWVDDVRVLDLSEGLPDAYTDTFDDDMGPWSTSYAVNPWHWESGIGHDAYGAYMIGAPYANNEDSWLYLDTPLDASAGGTLSFWTAYDVESGFDAFRVWVSPDGTWSGTEQWVAEYDGSAPLWTEKVIDLSDFAGDSEIYIAFQLESDWSIYREGVKIDDVTFESIGGLEPVYDDTYAYATWNGTSMATPHVAGIAALVKAYDPSLAPVDVRELIQNAVDTKSALSGKCVTGGRVNANRTLNLASGSSNTAPVATADAYSTPANTKLTVAAPGVLGNDTDAEGDPLVAVTVAGPAHGTLALNTNGSFTYTPAAGYVGGDSFTYKANDAELDSNTVTVTLTVTPKTITIDNAEGGVTFARYFTGLGASFSGGSYTYAYSRAPFVGTRLEARFYGNQVKWIGPKQDFYGKAKVYIDGVYKTTVDCYSATPVASTAIYTSPTLSEAWHTVTVEMVDGRNPASTNNVVVIDHFEVTGAAPKKAATRLSETAGTFTGNWIPVAGNPTYTDSTYAYSYWLGHRYTLRFTGTKVAWLGPKVYNYGRAGVYLDGVYKGTVSQYAAPAVTAFRAKVWESATLASGTHTLEIRPLATKDAASAGKVIVLDAFDVTP